MAMVNMGGHIFVVMLEYHVANHGPCQHCMWAQPVMKLVKHVSHKLDEDKSNLCDMQVLSKSDCGNCSGTKR